MNFSSPIPATNFSPRASRADDDADPLSSGRIRSRDRTLSSTRCSIINIMSRGAGGVGGCCSKKKDGGLDELDLDKSYRGAVHRRVMSSEPDANECCSSPIVDREPSVKLQRPSLRATPSVLGLDDSRGSHMTASTLALDDSLNFIREMHNNSNNLSLASMCADAAATSRGPKGVTFGTVEVREYPRTLGCNPAVTSGPPIAVGWEYSTPSAVVDVDAYEWNKPPRREKFQMLVPRFVREEWLMKAGYSRGEINEAIKEVEIIKESRRKNCLGANARRIQAIRDVLRLGTKRAR